jgi:predicted TIM-barrel fold metal-dependent hydrolase
VRTVVTPTLERQRQAGAVAVKFEAAYLRALDFDDPDVQRARRVYARYVTGGRPSHADYKALEDYLFRVIAREAGRLGMAVHIHAFEGGGGFYQVAGSDPFLLEPAFNDSTLRGTTFVVVHGGGGPFARHTVAMFWKPNVYADFSVSTLTMSATSLAGVLREWLAQYPERVLFGTDASASGPDLSWDVVGWLSAHTGRQALAIALTGMMRDGEITRARAEEIAMMVMRTNAARLYNLTLR